MPVGSDDSYSIERSPLEFFPVHRLEAYAEREGRKPHFDILPGAPPDRHERTPSGWLVAIYVKQYKSGKVLLIDGENLVVSSNNSLMVPNDDSVLKGKTGTESRRVIEFYTLSSGGAYLDARRWDGQLAFPGLQIHVSPVSGKYPSFIALKAPQQALNSADTPGPYHMMYSESIKSGEKAADIIGKIHTGVNHVAISCHSFTPGVLALGEGLSIDNVDVFRDLRINTSARVIWIGACSVAGPPEGMNLCKEMAKRSGCYVVAPGIGVAGIKTPVGRIDFFGPSFPKYFDPKGELIAGTEFLKLGGELGFTIEARY
jgi:hypothetical protein